MSQAPDQVMTFPLHGTHLLEASAGTGKTWNMASLYVRFILGHERDRGGLIPRDLLVVTFTRAATQELQDRIRHRLNETARFIETLSVSAGSLEDSHNAMSGDALLDGLKDYYLEHPDHQTGDAYRLHLAADSMDDAAIHTIHGWCQRMLKQHAFDSGSLFDLTLETDEGERLRACVRDFWRTCIYPLSRKDLRWIHLVAKDPESLLSAIKDLLMLPTEALHALAGDAGMTTNRLDKALHALDIWSEERTRLEDQLRQLWASDGPAIISILEKAKAAGDLNNQVYNVNYTRWVDAIIAWSKDPALTREGFKLENFATGEFRLSPKGSPREPEHPAFETAAALLAHEKNTRALTELKTALRLVACAWVSARLEAEKHASAVLDQNDLVRKLHAAISGQNGGRLAAIIRQQYPIALIDEFQDTDPLQYAIFKAIYGRQDRDHAWWMVGDPKQAIYSFRGADIYAYLDARRQPGITRHALTTNFRSTVEMVSAVNQVFGYAEARDVGAFDFDTGADGKRLIGFEKTQARDRNERLYEKTPEAVHPITGLRFWHLQNGDQPIGSGAFIERMAEVCAHTITDLLNRSHDPKASSPPAVFFADRDLENARPLQPQDMAILVANWKEAHAIQRALERRNLKSVYLSDRDSIFKTPEARDLILWLEAFMAPREGRRIRAAMATATLNLEAATLLQLTEDDGVLDGVIERFLGYGSLWRDQGILPALHQFILDQSLPATRLERPSGERTLTNVLHLAELLQREAASLDGQQGLLRFLRESIEGSGQEDEHILRLESDHARIRVITIHKSKGLEFPLVFLPFAALTRPLDGQSGIYKYHDDALRLRVSLEANSDENPSPLACAERERRQETLRLLYVALTRARHACWVGIGPYKKGASERQPKAGPKDETTLHQGALGYLLKGGELIKASELPGLLEALRGEEPAIQVETIDTPPPFITYQGPADLPTRVGSALRFKGDAFETWRIDSYSRLVGYTVQGEAESRQDLEEPLAREPETAMTATPQGLHCFPAGPRHGDFLHRLLEAAGREGFDRVAEDALLRQTIIRKALLLESYEDRWQEALDHWLTRFLTQSLMLGSTPLTLCDLSVTDCRMEMEFWLEIRKARLKAIDRVVSEHLLKDLPRPPLREEHLNGMLKGFMDLTFRHNGQFYVADYKSNRLGKTDAAYTVDAQNREVLKHRYDLQYALYTLALHRYLKSRLGSAYDYDQRVGGVAYLFLRGLEGPSGGVHFIKPPRPMIEALDGLFSGQSQAVADGV